MRKYVQSTFIHIQLVFVTDEQHFGFDFDEISTTTSMVGCVAQLAKRRSLAGELTLS